jgi:hypothetical protein
LKLEGKQKKRMCISPPRWRKGTWICGIKEKRNHAWINGEDKKKGGGREKSKPISSGVFEHV